MLFLDRAVGETFCRSPCADDATFEEVEGTVVYAHFATIDRVVDDGFRGRTREGYLTIGTGDADR